MTTRNTRTGKRTSSSNTRKSTASPRKTAAEKRKEAALKNEIAGIILILMGVLILLFIFGSSTGTVGAFVCELILRLFGTFGRAAFGTTLILHGIALITGRRAAAGYIYVLFMASTCAVGLTERTYLPYALNDPLLYASLWLDKTTAGAVGCFIDKLLITAFQQTASWVIIVFTCIIAFIAILKVSFVDILRTGADKAGKAAGEVIDSAKRRIARRRVEDPPKDTEPYPEGKTIMQTKNGDRIVFIEAGKKSRRTKKGNAPQVGDGFFDNSGIIIKDANRESSSGSFIDLRGKQVAYDEPGTEAVLPAKDPADRQGEKKQVSENFRREKLTAQEEDQALREVSAQVKEEALDDAGDRLYKYPPLSLLNKPGGKKSAGRERSEKNNEAASLVRVLSDYGIKADVADITIAPTVTRYELQLEPGVKMSKVSSLADDIAYAMAARQVRVEAPIPGKKAVGIEIPNREPATVWLSEVINEKSFTENRSPLAAVLGKTINGQTLVMDIAKMPHVLIAGATGSGKSVCINSIIMSILYHASPETVKMILIDPKMVELSVYNDIPHLLIPVVTSAKQASGALGWAVREMEDRYQKFHDSKVKDIAGYNDKMVKEGGEKLPFIVLIIDEFADLMMVAAQQVENSICRLAQLARACGIHLVLATQRPSVNVITGTIKANIPSRISFAVASQVDSRTILDSGGAEKLLGRGDMLYKPIDESSPIRAQGAYITNEEVEKIVEYIKEQNKSNYDEAVAEKIESETAAIGEKGGRSVITNEELDDDDYLVRKALEIGFANKNKLSTSMIQRRLRLGYARAGRIMDLLEEKGYVSAADGSKPRDVLITPEALIP
ncbi:MAG: DNA translocase FtsK [Eubacteriaceae bacterium]|nr:DNA translocase FtsK [Eubacteriaceae bacterium]